MTTSIMTLEEISAALKAGRALIAVCPETGYKSTPVYVDGDLIHTDRCCIPYCDVVDGIFVIYPVNKQ